MFHASQWNRTPECFYLFRVWFWYCRRVLQSSIFQGTSTSWISRWKLWLEIALHHYNMGKYIVFKRDWPTWCSFKCVNFSQMENVSHCNTKIRPFCSMVKYECVTSSYVGAILFEGLTWLNLLNTNDTVKKNSDFSAVLFFQRTGFNWFNRKTTL